MTDTPTAPSILDHLLTPPSCTSRQALESFLRTSRQYSDYRVSSADVGRGSSSSGQPGCGELVREKVYPAWRERDRVLVYCEDVAAQMEREAAAAAVAATSTTAESANVDAVAGDPRVDSYAYYARARHPSNTGTPGASAQAEDIKRWVAYERSVEAIVREGSDRILQRKCGPAFVSTSAQGQGRVWASYKEAYENQQ